MFKKSFLALVFSLSTIVSAADTLTIGTFPIPLMVENENKGVFVELVKTIAKKSGIEVKIQVAPPKRTMGKFFEKKVDMVFPALDVNFPAGKKVEKCPEIIYVKRDFAFTKKGSPMLKTVAELEEKKVGITRGYPYAAALTNNNLVKLEPANKDEQNAQKLAAGRIDAFVVEEKSGLKAFEMTKTKDKIQYDPKVPLSEQDVFFAFQATPNGKKYAALFAETLKAMKADGSFGKIMSKAK